MSSMLISLAQMAFSVDVQPVTIAVSHSDGRFIVYQWLAFPLGKRFRYAHDFLHTSARKPVQTIASSSMT